MNAPIDMNKQKILNFNRYVINVWNFHFKKILEVEDNSIFLYGREINTAAQQEYPTNFFRKIDYTMS